MSQSHALEGTVLGVYEIRERIGRGGMGEVYLARDVRLGRPVALKVLTARSPRTSASASGCCASRGWRRASTTRTSIPVYDAGEADGRLFIAMRYVDGATSRPLLRARGPLAPARAVRDRRPDRRRARRRPSARPRAPRRQAEQRPARPRGRARALLPGRLRPHAERARRRTRPTGSCMGTVDYVAPEQIRGDALDGRADQYALGCLLFECLTGSLPFRQRSDVAAIFAHLEEPPPARERAQRALPAAVDAGARARHGKGARGALRQLSRSWSAATHEALGLDRGGPAAGALARPGARARLAAVAAAAVALGLGRDATATAAGPSGSLVRVDPRTNQVVAPRRGPGLSGQARGDAGRHLDGATSARASSGATTRRRRPERITSNGEPRDIAALGDKVYVARGRATPSRASSRATTPSPACASDRSTCWPARWRPARAWSGRPAARSCSG